MSYALIATIEQELSYWSMDDDDNPVYITKLAPPGTILNIIHYDGNSLYIPPEGSELKQVIDTAKIGDTGYFKA